eukprot:4883626-Amphidinium_carterae.1
MQGSHADGNKPQVCCNTACLHWGTSEPNHAQVLQAMLSTSTSKLERLWQWADADGDGLLNRAEVAST